MTASITNLQSSFVNGGFDEDNATNTANRLIFRKNYGSVGSQCTSEEGRLVNPLRPFRLPVYTRQVASTTLR